MTCRAHTSEVTFHRWIDRWRRWNIPEKKAAALKYKRQKYSENPDKQKEYWKRWYEDPTNRAKEKERATVKGQDRNLRRVSWAMNDPRIQLLYEKASEYGMHVDHVIPLQGKLVSGLHVWENLQLLDPALNISKGNRLEINDL
jgi:hypothetical protein